MELNDKHSITKALCMYKDSCDESQVNDSVDDAIQMLDDCETIAEVDAWLKENI